METWVQDAGAKAAIHAMRDIFTDVNEDAFLLLDVENAFHSIKDYFTWQCEDNIWILENHLEIYKSVKILRAS